MLMIMSYFDLGLALYHLFKAINKNVALVLLTLNLIGVPLMALNMLNQCGALLVLKVEYLNVFSIEQIQALSLLFMDLHEYGYHLAALSYGTWLFPVGYLAYKFGFIPRVIGVFLMAAAIAILFTMVTKFAFPQYFEIVSTIEIVPSVLGEFGLCFWLLIKGVKRNQLELGK